MANSESTGVSTSSSSSGVASASVAKMPSRMPQMPAKVPPFQTNRFLKSTTAKHSQPPAFLKEEHTVDIERLSLVELKELLKKQNHLAHSKFIAKLKDKGEKIIAFRDKIEAQIKLKEEINGAEVMLEKLTINSNVRQCSEQFLFWLHSFLTISYLC